MHLSPLEILMNLIALFMEDFFLYSIDYYQMMGGGRIRICIQIIRLSIGVCIIQNVQECKKWTIKDVLLLYLQLQIINSKYERYIDYGYCLVCDLLLSLIEKHLSAPAHSFYLHRKRGLLPSGGEIDNQRDRERCIYTHK